MDNKKYNMLMFTKLPENDKTRQYVVFMSWSKNHLVVPY